MQTKIFLASSAQLVEDLGNSRSSSTGPQDGQTRSFARLGPRRACAVAFERTLRWNSFGNRNRHVCDESPSPSGSLSSRYQWFGSISLQRGVGVSRDFSFARKPQP